ncbi:MAG: glycosyltransferase family 2 protein, partial [Lachnospiraceae bacterium]|nr:glycosyltransferase family 2 protein [Lachnospiraceae bacterium]
MSNDYKELYEKEREKNREFAIRIAGLEEENASLSYRLDRIHNNPIWRHTKWIRDFMLRTGKLKTRIKNLGGVKGFLSKVAYKIREAKAKKSYGRRSFPDASRRAYEEGYEFEYRPLISILVPLYNTPIGFLMQMTESVKVQTYKNWEL